MKKANNFEQKEIPGRLEGQEYFSEEKFVQELIEDIKTRFEEIFQNLHPEVIREILESDLIVGEDASGRLPALFLYKLSELLRENINNNQLRPHLLFFAGFGNVNLAGNKSEKYKIKRKKEITTRLINFIEKHFGGKDNINITIVTDLISSGKSIEPLIDSIVNTIQELKK
jgi:hypothetical protein